MVSVLSTVVQSFRTILQHEGKPLGAHNTLVNDLKNGMRVQTKTAQKDFLEVCLRKKLYPKDINATAKH